MTDNKRLERERERERERWKFRDLLDHQMKASFGWRSGKVRR